MIDINEDEEALGAPFMLMQQLDGVAASPFTPDAYSPHEEELGQQFWSILGEIAKKDITDDFINQFDNTTEDPCWKKELDKWVTVIKEDSISIEPILEAGIRKLYKKPPKEPIKKSLVHGDYRNGNFLFNENKIIIFNTPLVQTSNNPLLKGFFTNKSMAPWRQELLPEIYDYETSSSQ